ncbi:MAG: glycosyltransferase family 2 protein [bacterium]
MKLAVVIPAYNEEGTIQAVIDDVHRLTTEVFVVDDGSIDNTPLLARATGARVIQHIVNRGLGGALGTGIQAALNQGADIIVTFDADGQHQASDIAKLIKPIQEGQADVVIGSRMIDKDKTRQMPAIRRFYNWLGNRVTFFLFGIRTSDSQSGLRAFSRIAAQKLEIRSNKMEVSSELIYEIKRHGFRFIEIPIESIYTQYSMSKPTGQNLITGIKTFLRLLFLRIIK